MYVKLILGGLFYMLLKAIKNAKKKKEKAKKVKTVKKMAAVATVGSAVGAIAGVLLAPKSGKETRQDISDNINSASESVKISAGNMKEKAVGILNKVKTYLAKANKFVADLREKKLEESIKQDDLADE